MILVWVGAIAITLLLARFVYVTLHMAINDRDGFGTLLMTLATLAIAAGGLLVLTNLRP